ncbi:VOC family protein [Micromonospora robiginosa]|uniref:VOC domain-containing protein n=1 Tax=Micromonospora robiginosa TaxID=2749844 RepID=A0A7L6BB46_9ACTN|nr:hypothetical protein [Micromonospora ferruginea]QLQ39095.1 hypothetical protein H1D33_09850 [Micromonospora ferruginea]
MFDSALVNLHTADIEAGIRFYRDLLGSTETFRAPTEGVPEHDSGNGNPLLRDPDGNLVEIVSKIS